MLEYLDGLVALIVGLGWVEYRVRRAVKAARQLHDDRLDVSRSLYERLAMRLSHHIEGKVHD